MSVEERQTAKFLYPRDLAKFVQDRWEKVRAGWNESNGPGPEPLPPIEVLEWIISVCYQASNLKEELRPVTLRLILGDPHRFPPDQGPPRGLQPLVFDEYRSFTPDELRSLSPAAAFHRSLIGVELDPHNNPYIWGIIQSGPSWLKKLRGGRGSAGYLPPYLTIYVTGPGRVEVNCGLTTIGQLRDGRVYGPSMNVFDSKWYPRAFAEYRGELVALHNAERAIRGSDWAELDYDVTRIIGQHTTKRIITSMRSFRHGGTLIFVEPELAELLTRENPYLHLKYRFTEGPSRSRFRFLMLSIMETLASMHGKCNEDDEMLTVGWEEYAASRDEALGVLDESIFEMAHLIASLSTVDGAVILTKRWELLGFASEITCHNSDVKQVARALDLEADQVLMESTEGVGTRHRSVYRFCNQHRGSIGVVASQDGDVRIVRWMDGRVTYWDHQATTNSVDF
jgi:hypothetical protein